MTEASSRRILSERFWPDGLDVDDLEGLLRVFECHEIGDLEDHLHGLLPEDPGDVSIYDDGGSVSIHTAGVLMWWLAFPFSAPEFDAYLFELDERMTLQKLLWELPDAQSWEDDKASILPQLAATFRTTPEEFSAALGDDWHPLDLDWVGSTSSPSNYLWTGRCVIGIDNDNAYLFRPSASTDTPLGFDLEGEPFEEVGWATEIWKDGGPSLDWFVPFVLEGSGLEGRGTCPSCGSGDVTHIVFGLPADPGEFPSWVQFGGCVIDGQPKDRVCESCGREWAAERNSEAEDG